MNISAEEYWAEVEGLRNRVRTLSGRENRHEHASIDEEITALRERVWAALKAVDNKRA